METAPISRTRVLALAEAGLSQGEPRYTRRITLAWLALYPGDLPMKLLHTRALQQDDLPGQALTHLEKICQTDPEYLEGQQALADARQRTGLGSAVDTAGCAFALGGGPGYLGILPQWASALRRVRQALATCDLDKAAKFLQPLLSLEAEQPLIAVTRLRLLRERRVPPQAQHKFIQQARQQWPECLPILLAEADLLMETGHPDEAVAQLHRAASRDVTGQVAERWWGRGHSYQNLWPERLEAGTYGPSALHDIPIPARVAAALGQNLLESGKLASQLVSKSASQPVNELANQPIGEAAEQQVTQLPIPPVTHSPNHPLALDGRFPAYIILTTQRGLQVQYGETAGQSIIKALHQLVQAIQARGDMDALLLIADDPLMTGKFGLPAAAHNDAWGIKRLLTDLDTALVKRGERIGALLIAGGPQVVPFHHLPNPVDDADADVPSDNPYACRDENYFTPEWPIGRLPGDTSRDPGPLLRTIANIIQRHRQQNTQRKQSWWKKFARRLAFLFGKQRTGLGYTAAVWRRSSQAVYRALQANSGLASIGRPGALLISPPVEAGQVTLNRPSRLAYFNLHGIPDSAVWYGQRDPSEPGDHPHFPVALRPQDVRNGGAAPQIVFSEACYGAHILEKTVEEALALKFLASGSRAVIGSTCTSYGSVNMPLIAADLLGRFFGDRLQDGLPVGEALRRAKITLAQEMIKRQGYLDGEDQKTLIAFILYGDPLAQVGDTPVQLKSSPPPAIAGPLPTLNDTPGQAQPLPAEVLAQVKEVVAHYLPGMESAHPAISRQHRKQPGAKSVVVAPQVITLSCWQDENTRRHPQLARLTLDEGGNLVKLVVSR